MELMDTGGTLQVRVQPRGGAVHQAEAIIEGTSLVVSVNRDTTWQLQAEGDKISGVEKRGDKEAAKLSGVRAPSLNRPMPKAWTKPVPLFNGKDLSGWEPLGKPENSHWVVRDGELINEAKGSNIKTTHRFDDFRLHIEVKCTEHCNSGIYLRGRYEIQVGTEGGTQSSHEMGAIYGYAPAAAPVSVKEGDWNIFDITLVGRHVTVVRNGVKIHDNQELAGITGGALDAHEAEPGPFFLQGDHSGGLHYRNITVAVPKR
jgi:hypothetical protein